MDFSWLGGFGGYHSPSTRRARDALVPSAHISRRRRAWWCGRATTSARRRKKDRRDHVRGTRRSWTRGASSRVDRTSAALGRGLSFRRVSSWFFTCRPRRWRRRLSEIVRVLELAKPTKAVLSGPLLAFWGRGEQNNSDVVAASHGRVLNRDSLCTPSQPKPLHPRRKNSARDEG